MRVNRHWYDNIFLEFYINIPLLRIETQLLRESFHMLRFVICMVRIKLWRWEWSFQLYKKPEL